MESQEIHFYSDGLRLAGNLHLPATRPGDGPVPAVVLCHGLGGIKDLILPDLAAPLVAAGFAVLRFDYRGFGASEGPRWRLIPMEQVCDIRDAVTFLETVEAVDPRRIGLYGTSFGGANAIVATACDARVRCLVSQVAVADGAAWMRALRPHWAWLEFGDRLRADRLRRVREGKSEYVSSDEIMPPDPHSDRWHAEVLREFPERRYDLPLETAERIVEYRPIEYASRLAHRASLFIAADNDPLAPVDQLYALYEAAPEPKRFHTVRDTTHHGMYSGRALEESTGEATAWFREHLEGERP